MKKIFLYAIFCQLILGCKKNPFDYRTKYVGDYSFTIHYSSWSPFYGQFDTTYSIDGKIDYGSIKNTISIIYSGSTSPQMFTIYEDGTIEDDCKGEFESANKIKYSCYWASPAAHTFESVIGEKK